MGEYSASNVSFRAKCNQSIEIKIQIHAPPQRNAQTCLLKNPSRPVNLKTFSFDTGANEY